MTTSEQTPDASAEQPAVVYGAEAEVEVSPVPPESMGVVEQGVASSAGNDVQLRLPYLEDTYVKSASVRLTGSWQTFDSATAQSLVAELAAQGIPLLTK